MSGCFFLKHGVVVTRPLKVERMTVSVRRPKTGVPPTVLRNQHVYLHTRKISRPMLSKVRALERDKQTDRPVRLCVS